jgi:hypothetical protein
LQWLAAGLPHKVVGSRWSVCSLHLADVMGPFWLPKGMLIPALS